MTWYKKLANSIGYQPVILICGVLGALAMYLFTTFAPGVNIDLANRIVLAAISLILSAWAHERVTPVSPEEQATEKADVLQRIKDFQDLAKILFPQIAPINIDNVTTTIENTPPINFGYVRSPVDHRDKLYSRMTLSPNPIVLPDFWDWNQEFGPLPVLDQGQNPACVGYSLAALKIAQERFETGSYLSFDGLSIYDKVALPGGGAYIRDALKFLQQTGVPGADGTSYRIYSYAGIDPKDHFHVKHAIYKWGCVSLGFDVPASFVQGGGKEFSVQGDGDTIVGGHAILAVGYTDSGVLLHNSWGPQWGLNGRALVTWDFWDQYVSEVWAVVDAKDRPGVSVRSLTKVTS